ncbi:hypothetical protein GCM10022284_71300 [Streptomyces hundungensis]
MRERGFTVPGEPSQPGSPSAEEPDSPTDGGRDMRRWWLTMAEGNPQDDSDSGNKHGGGGSDEGGNTNDGQTSADGK